MKGRFLKRELIMDHSNPAQAKVNEYVANFVQKLVDEGPGFIQNPITRKMIIHVAEQGIKDELKHSRETSTAPLGVQDDKAAFSLAILRTAERALTEYDLSKETIEGLMGVLVRDQLVDKSIRENKAVEFEAQYGGKQPSFLTISPSKACNLRCIGCYADSDASAAHLEWDVVDRIVTEANQLWSSKFMVISGGEPLAYKSQGKTILDLAEKHPDVYFMFYTNSTLITEEIAERMRKLGNIIPAISVEGWREKTDTRRGAGVFDKIMQSMDLLYSRNVPFGVSLTATRENAEEILSDEFIDFLFNKKHALFGWVFQYMPIGRSYTLDMMPTPEQRVWMWHQSWQLIREKRIFLADFWNHGTIVGGCLSAGGSGNGGYFYIDWNGSISPCVFVPYTPVNINRIYEKGGNLNDVWKEPFFSDIRSWQKGYKKKNLMAPCLIRDHNDVLRQLIRENEPEPSDDNARQATLDPKYAEGLDQYSAKFQEITDPIWKTYYVRPGDSGAAKIADLPDIPAPEVKRVN